MQINTVIHKRSDWFVKVHTMLAQYQGKGKYYTCCSVRFNSGSSIALLSMYTKSDETAINMHKEICLRAKALFDLK